MQKIIYTIGHSTRSLDEFMSMLEIFSIELLADVRSYPGSRKYPHFNKENLAKEIPARNILYLHLPALGGRRKTSPQSKNTAWKNDSFRGYADYMETDEFKKGIEELGKSRFEVQNCFYVFRSGVVEMPPVNDCRLLKSKRMAGTSHFE
jgi:uncharacterized protein (DUF488 family)